MKPARKAISGPVSRLVARRPATVVLGLSALLAAACVWAYLAERQPLKQVVDEMVRTSDPNDQVVRSLARVVYEVRGWQANSSYFILPSRRATPLQILRHGGDCSDRSLLLCALLSEAGLDATRVMLFDPVTGLPSHTVVDAALGPGRHMVVDPSYDLCFPNENEVEGSYYGLDDMRNDPSILSQRLSYLRARLPRRTRLNVYPVDKAGYTSASSFNWNKNRLSRLIFGMLHPSWGAEIYRLRRPGFLEQPHLFCAVLVSGLGVVVASGIRLGKVLYVGS